MIKLKAFIEKLVETDVKFQLDWDLIQEMADALDLVATTTKAFQREDMILSEVYAEWLVLIEKLKKKMNSTYSKILLKAVETEVCSDGILTYFDVYWYT